MSVPIGFEQARAAAARFLHEPVTHFKEVVVRDPSGGSTSKWVEQAYERPLKGWIAAPSARRAAGGMADREPLEIAYQVENTKVVVLTLPYGVPVSEGDQFEAVNRRWIVTGELTLDSPRSVSTRVLMRETDPPRPEDEVRLP